MNALVPPVSENDKQTGSRDFQVTLVEYGDYECPFCGMAYPLVKRLLKERSTVLRFVFRNFPLQTIHPCATSAAIAAEAASLQGRFWEMHDLLFENQDRFAEKLFPKLAAQLGMDLDQFRRDIARDVLRTKVNADFKSGLHSGVNGTPSFFVNGEKIELPVLAYDALLGVVDEYLSV